MKLFSVILLALFFSHCSNPALPTEQPPVSLTFVEATEFDVNLLLKNNTTESLLYYGYSKSSPLKTIEILTDTGWTVAAWDWCGTGAEQQKVKPNESVVIFAPVIKKNVKTRIAFSYNTSANEEYTKLTSNEYIVK